MAEGNPASQKSVLPKSIIAKVQMRRNPKGAAQQTVVSFEVLQALITGDGSVEDVRNLLSTASNKQQLLTQREDGWTLFHTACSRGKLHVAFLLAAEGSDCNATTPNGSTGLHFLALLGRDECHPQALYLQLLAELLRQGAQMHLVNSTGETCLHMATSRKNDIAVQFFLEHGCNLSATTKQGDTALHYAVNSSSLPLITLLLEAGADAKATNNAGHSPIELSRKGPPAIFELLQKHGGMTDSVKADAKGEESAGHGGEDGLSGDEEASARLVVAPSLGASARDASDEILVSEPNGGKELPCGHVIGCWETYRNEFYGKKHLVYWASSSADAKALAIVTARPQDGVFRGLAVASGDWVPFSFSADQLLLYSSSSNNTEESEHIRQVLGTVKATLVWPQVSWQLCKNPLTLAGTHLLALEAKLGSRPRLCIGVVYGSADQQTEAEMFENTQGSAKFEEFLDVLGERIDVSTWKAWKGTFTGINDHQVAYYTSWRGFELVFHVSTHLDAAKQRQHIGNDTVNIFFKQGSEMPECAFRGKVNACGLVVLCPDDHGDELQLGAFYRSWIDGFEARLGSKRASLGNPNQLREVLFTNAINASYLAVKSGPYKNNRFRLFDQNVGEIIAMEDAPAGGAFVGGEDSVIGRPGLLKSQKSILKERLPEKPPRSNTKEAKEVDKQLLDPAELETRKPVGDELRVGWLWKSHSKFKAAKSRKKRWCILKAEGLYYFEQDGMERLGCIQMTNIRECDMVPENAASRNFLKGEFLKGDQGPAFYILCGDGERYEFSSFTDNISDLKGWIKEIQGRKPAVEPKSPVASPRGPLGGGSGAAGVDVELPDFLSIAMDHVIRRGVFREGLLRDNQGDHSLSDALCAEWKRSQRPDLAQTDPLVISAAIRKYMNEFTFLSISQNDEFLSCSKLDTVEAKMDVMVPIVRSSALLTGVLEFLSRIYMERGMNKMSAGNLAALFAPCFMRADQENPLSLLQNTKAMTSMVELLIRHVHCCQLVNEDGWRWCGVEVEDAESRVSSASRNSSAPAPATTSSQISVGSSAPGGSIIEDDDDDPFADESDLVVTRTAQHISQARKFEGRIPPVTAIASASGTAAKPRERPPDELSPKGRAGKPILGGDRAKRAEVPDQAKRVVPDEQHASTKIPLGSGNGTSSKADLDLDDDNDEVLSPRTQAPAAPAPKPKGRPQTPPRAPAPSPKAKGASGVVPRVSPSRESETTGDGAALRSSSGRIQEVRVSEGRTSDASSSPLGSASPRLVDAKSPRVANRKAVTLPRDVSVAKEDSSVPQKQPPPPDSPKKAAGGTKPRLDLDEDQWF